MRTKEMRFLSEPKLYTQADIEAAVLAEREAIASWYETTGYFLDEGDVAAAIRARGDHA